MTDGVGVTMDLLVSGVKNDMATVPRSL